MTKKHLNLIILLFFLADSTENIQLYEIRESYMRYPPNAQLYFRYRDPNSFRDKELLHIFAFMYSKQGLASALKRSQIETPSTYYG